MGVTPHPRPEGVCLGVPRGEGVPGTDASLLDPHPPNRGYPGGRGGGRPRGGHAPPIPAERCRVPPRGVGGGGRVPPDWSPDPGGGVPFSKVWRGEGEGGLPGVGRLSPLRGGGALQLF